jgi:hypothetical protein
LTNENELEAKRKFSIKSNEIGERFYRHGIERELEKTEKMMEMRHAKELAH